MNEADFQKLVWQHYLDHQRQLPWRLPESDGTFDAYKILVSELMLQQTQVSRVISKYEAFLLRFPTVQTLSKASLRDVLKLWSGLGYNRRARYLHQVAKQLAGLPQPWAYDMLVAQPGIGPNTANAVLAYSYNQPVAFVETNIRTIFLHHFFADHTGVSDKQILEVVRQTLPKSDPYREWYWALMDYGSFLKRQAGSQLHRSRSYHKQSPFSGSRRQLRGQIIKLLTTQSLPITRLNYLLPDTRLPEVLHELQSEGLILKRRTGYELAS